MTQPLTFVISTTGLDNFKELRKALSSDARTKLLAGGDDADQLFEEIVRLRPSAAIVVMGANAENSLDFISRIASECSSTAIISAAENPSPDLILRSMRAGARDFLRLPINSEEFNTILDRTAQFCAGQVALPKKKGRMIAVFSSKGGCGTSFLATNIASSTGAPTALVDLKFGAGTKAKKAHAAWSAYGRTQRRFSLPMIEDIFAPLCGKAALLQAVESPPDDPSGSPSHRQP